MYRVIAIAMLCVVACFTPNARAAQLNLVDSAVLLQARLAGSDRVPVLMLTTIPDRSLAPWLRQHGAQIQSQRPDIGYVRAFVPISVVAALVQRSDVASVSLYPPAAHAWCCLVGLQGNGFAPHIEDVEGPSLSLPVMRVRPLPLQHIPSSSPAFGNVAIGAPAFQHRYPTYDGRGTGIAIVESLGQLDHPALSGNVPSLDGAPVRKLSGIVVAADDPNRLPDAFPWDAFVAPGKKLLPPDRWVVARHGIFSIDGAVYRAPHNGRYRFGWRVLVNESLHERSPRPTVWAILWNPQIRGAWVDTRHDRDFATARMLNDFNTSGDLAHLPIFDAAAALVYNRNGVPVLAGANGDHATMTSTTAAGSPFAKNDVGAPARNARVVFVDFADRSMLPISTARSSRAPSIDFGSAPYIQSEGVAIAARRPDVDVISDSSGWLSTCMFTCSFSFTQMLYDRIVAQNGKLIFVAAGNSEQWTESADESSTGSRVLGIGGYTSGKTYTFLQHDRNMQQDYVDNYSFGPAYDGAMDPEVLAPSEVLSGSACHRDPIYQKADGQTMAWSLPQCTELGGGTSQATPSGATAGLVLISAAKQARIPIDDERLAFALKAGARFLPTWPANAQGAGLIQLQPSWDWLRTIARWPRWAYAPQISIAAPVDSDDTSLRVGRGVYFRTWPAAGYTKTVIVVLTRMLGPDRAIPYTLSWLGNDGTFRAPSTVTLRRGIAARIAVRIHPLTGGLHSANMVVRDARTGAPVCYISHVIIVPHDLSQNGGTATAAGVRPWFLVRPIFVHVPQGAQALRVDENITSGFSTIMIREPTLYSNTYAFDKNAPVWSTSTLAPISSTVVYPRVQTGVWQFNLTRLTYGDMGDAQAPDSHYSLRFRAYRVDISGTASSNTVTLNLTNRLAPLTAPYVRISPAAELHERIATIGDPARTRFIDVTVPSGSTLLRIDARSLSGKSANLFVYYCRTLQPCVPFTVPEIDGMLVIRMPRAGHWKVAAEPTDFHVGRFAYDLSVAIANPSYGNITQPSMGAPIASEARWQQQINVDRNPAAVPPAMRPVIVVEAFDADVDRAADQSVKEPRTQAPTALGTAILPIAP